MNSASRRLGVAAAGSMDIHELYCRASAITCTVHRPLCRCH